MLPVGRTGEKWEVTSSFQLESKSPRPEWNSLMVSRTNGHNNRNMTLSYCESFHIDQSGVFSPGRGSRLHVSTHRSSSCSVVERCHRRCFQPQLGFVLTKQKSKKRNFRPLSLPPPRMGEHGNGSRFTSRRFEGPMLCPKSLANHCGVCFEELSRCQGRITVAFTVDSNHPTMHQETSLSQTTEFPQEF